MTTGSDSIRPSGPLRRWRDGGWMTADATPAAPRCPEEAAVAIVVDGASQAVLMATPQNWMILRSALP